MGIYGAGSAPTTPACTVPQVTVCSASTMQHTHVGAQNEHIMQPTVCASMKVERGQIRTVCVFYITILYYSLALFDPCHYNFHISEICHHYSSIWKLAITIVPVHVPYHFLHLKRDRTHLQIVVFSYHPKYHAERASSCCRRVGAWASHHYRAGEPSPPRGQAVAAARVSQCHWASARVSRHHTGTTTAAAKDWTYRTPSPRRRT